MLGAIKRRWKSKKAKVVYKGGELSPSNNDNCSPSRGFVDECEEFEKIKPPSPRQIHPVIEVVDVKFNNPKSPLLNNRKSTTSTLPLASDESPPPFIRVNSGRIELVNSITSSNNNNSRTGNGSSNGGSPHYHLPHPPPSTGSGVSEILSEKLRRRLGGRLLHHGRNDSRHSWCGGIGGPRDGQIRMKGCTTTTTTSGLVLSALPAPNPSYPSIQSHQTNSTIPSLEDPTYSDPIEEKEILRLRTSLLQERLDVVETLTKNCQTWQRDDKKEVERTMSDLASQVSQAVTLQQLMKSEVDKLQERIQELETHNRALATMIVPTLMKLHDTIGRETGTTVTVPRRRLDTRTTTTTSSTGESSTDEIKKNGSNSGCQKSLTFTSGSSLKYRKIDCRIPRINSTRLNKTKHPSNSTTTLTPVDLSSPDPLPPILSSSSGGTPSITPTMTSSLPLVPISHGTHQQGKTHTPINSSSYIESLPNSSLSPPSSSSSFPKSKSSNSTNTKGILLKGGGSKSSTFSGIPRITSPRPLQSDSRNVPVTKGSRPNKNDSQKTSSHDLHNNGSSSRLPIRKTFPSISTKTNPSKVLHSSIIHHQQQSNHIRNPTHLGINNTKPQLPFPTNTIPTGKIVGTKDEGYSTMSSEALEQDASSSLSSGLQMLSTLTKSKTFSTFANTLTNRNIPQPPMSSKQLITGEGDEIRLHSPLVRGDQRTWTKTGAPNMGNPTFSHQISKNDNNENGETFDDMEPPSYSGETIILWEDSDDSDILFLPVEGLSTTPPSSGTSSPTLVPPSSSWTSTSNSAANTSVGLPSSSSFSTTSTLTNGQGEEGHYWEYPLRRVHGGQDFRTPSGELNEERALIEKWMRLEDVRNQVRREDEWAWDWDGVERTHLRNPPFFRKFHQPPPLQIVEESSTPPNSPAGGRIPIDTNTWTKSKGKRRNEIGDNFEAEKQLVTNGMSVSDVGMKMVDESEVTLETTPSPPPPVIEFTPEFYRLVKYGSQSSVTDREQLINSGKFENRRASFYENVSSPSPSCMRMDDKISQTDFGSSIENLSVSSELFTECRNCLELIKRLVVGIDETECTSQHLGIPGIRPDDNSSSTNSLERTIDELGTDKGAPTTWIALPNGLPLTEVDRILEILSSSESEDILSPQSTTKDNS